VNTNTCTFQTIFHSEKDNIVVNQYHVADETKKFPDYGDTENFPNPTCTNMPVFPHLPKKYKSSNMICIKTSAAT
jgi:hypothetical protein